GSSFPDRLSLSSPCLRFALLRRRRAPVCDHLMTTETFTPTVHRIDVESQVAGRKSQVVPWIRPSGSAEEQMQIAELVPEVALAQGFPVCGLEVRAAGDRFEHREM